MPELGDDSLDRSGKVKRDKVRSVWISFVGRIVAQIIGAVASVVLGLFILQRYQDDPAEAPRAATPAPAPAPRTHGEQAIAVLPLDNFSRDPADAYFAQGMTEVLISDLAQIKGWRVISRTSTEAYRNTGKSLAQIGAELNVDLIVEGSVTKDGDQVRVVTQLINAKTDEHIWARSYDRSTKDVLTLQGELAREIAKSVKAAILPAHDARMTTRAALDPAVYDLYLRGRHAWNLRTPEGLSAAVRFFSDAVKQEPSFALAHVGLADAYIMGGTPSAGRGDARERIERARASASRALDIAGHMAETHTAYGGVLFFGDRDVAGAERSFRRALELNPNYPIAHQWLAILLAEQGRDAEARRHADAAVTLDPMEATLHQAAGLVHYYGGRFAEAAAAERRAVAIRPQLPFARVMLIKALLMQGETGGATNACGQAGAAESENPELMVTCAIAFQRAGDARAATLRTRLDAMKPSPVTALVQWHAATGDLDRAFQVAATLKAQDNLPPNLAFDPLFAALRADARYKNLLNR
jgi:TolB-like protein/Flp pilus assembly protein TadD